MCRMIVFAGTCTRCEREFTWDALTQQLWCLEAKNEDAFGQCRRGVQVDHHAFDQECERCEEEDEGVEVGDDFGMPAYNEHDYSQAASGSSSGGHHQHHRSSSGSKSKRDEKTETGRKRKKQKT